MDAGLRSGQSPQVKIVNTCSSPPQRCSLPSKRGGGAPTAVSTPLSLFGLACSATPFPLRRASKRSQVVIPQKAGTGSGTWSTFQDLILFHWLDPCIKRRGPSVIPPRRRRIGLRASAINRTPHTSHLTLYTVHFTLYTSHFCAYLRRCVDAFHPAPPGSRSSIFQDPHFRRQPSPRPLVLYNRPFGSCYAPFGELSTRSRNKVPRALAQYVGPPTFETVLKVPRT